MIADLPEDEDATAIQLSSQDLANAIGLLERLIGAKVGHSPSAWCDKARLFAVVRMIQVIRQSRLRHFAAAMFGEPAWDLLICLYQAEEKGDAQTASTLAKSADIAVSTALRWLDYLEEKRLILRQPSRDDRRTIILALSTLGRASVENYLQDVIGAITCSPELASLGACAKLA